MFVQSMYELGSKRSCIRELFDYGLRKAREIGAENVYDYSIGNPSVPAPGAVHNAIVEILEKESTVAVHGYTAATGTVDVRKTVSDDLNKRYGTALRPENMFFTCGAAPALVAILRALAVENSEFVILAPYFPEYTVFINCAGGKSVIVPADTKTFAIDVAAIEKSITAHTQAIIVNSPNNPSGVIYTREELVALAEMLQRKEKEYGHPIYIIADEPYRELVYDDAYVHYIPAIYPNTIICYSYSKVFSLPGERIGYFFVPDCVEDGARLFAAAAGAARIMGHVCAPSLQQQVVKACASVKPDLTEYDRNRTLLYEALTEYGYTCVKPQGAFYLFVKAPYGTAKEFSDRAKQENLLIVPGDDFGCPEYFRASTCVSYDMIKRSLPVFKKLIEEK